MSTSMYRETRDGRSKHEAAIAAAKAFADQLDLTPDGLGRHDRIGVAGFNDEAWTQLELSDDREAIDITNSTDYGLVSGVFTRDLDRAMAVARDIRAGQVFVNEWYAGGVETPFGGYGKSGYGRLAVSY